ncbi:MAG: endonuclease/exonuclease/phosphatase family protein [Verrucomicrobia bacterium]|nr:endonuclease/exonuclease/phosphatase family protein [Verrucomicrobiota bacterium]
MAALGGTLALLTSPACGKKHGSPEWNTPPQSSAPATTDPTAPVATPSRKTPKPATAESTTGLRFIAYNVNNWLTMDRTIDRTELKNVAKPAAEKHAVIQVLARHAPDVLGLCEIGTREDLAELQSGLQASGVDLPHSSYTGGSDEVRHLGLLSRFPITSTATPAQLDFKLNGVHFTMNRGILDATIEAHGMSYRLLGVHLKSKREVQEGDQDAMRFNEARLLRQHVDAILKAEPNARLVVYGDFNDTRGSASLRTITGNFNDPSYLTAIPVQDRQGLRWTHFWNLHDIYSRFDYIAITRTLKPAVDFNRSCIIDDPDWIDASDHRPLLAVFN